jgi:NAD+ kinase
MEAVVTPRSVAVSAHPKLPEALTEAAAIAEFLNNAGIPSAHGSLNDETLRNKVKQHEFDLLVVVGGDGTMLRAAHLGAAAGVPILGVNRGRLGFLFQMEARDWHVVIQSLLRGEGWIENRMMLRADHLRSGEVVGSWHALNDAVVSRGQLVRPVELAASVDGLRLATYVADGLIAATPTGSTAYALAAGGPILPPELRNILLVPIAPHLSVDRAVVLSEGVAVVITVQSENAVLSVDGQPPMTLAEDDRVSIRAAENTARFVRFGDPGYFYRTITAYMNQHPSLGISR